MRALDPSIANQLVEHLVDQARDGLVAIDEDGLVLFWSAGASALFGYSKQEALGNSILDLIVPPELQDIERTRLRGATKLAAALFQTTRRRKDGSQLHTEVSLRRVGTDHGFIAATERDISELRRLLDERRDEPFRGLLEGAPDPMVIVGREGQIVFVNGQTEKVFGYSRDELFGQPVEILVPERFRERHPASREGYSREPKIRPMGAGLELYARRRDGSEFAAEISLSPIATADGPLVIAAIRDISERKRLEEAEIRRKNQELEAENRRMQEANRLKSEFLANMSHELRTPLNAIIGFADLMFRGKVGPVSSEHKEYLGDILNSSRHLLQLINDVLDLAKIESGRMEFRPELLEPAKIIAEVRDILRGIAANKQIELETELDPAVREAMLDPAKLKQVLYNFLSNALKFTQEGGRVVVRLRPEPAERLCLEVEDTGIGIRDTDLPRLFVEFQQLDAGTAKRYPGTGLGLALTRRIVEAQGGEVRVQSELGKGSVFAAVLPLCRPPSTGAAERAAKR